jgi:glycosyltransferase involved in cell wall biosynthesis
LPLVEIIGGGGNGWSPLSEVRNAADVLPHVCLARRSSTEAMSNPEQVHIFNGFMNPFGGSEAEALALYDGISRIAPSTLWGISSRLHPAFYSMKIRRARSFPGEFPHHGVFVFVGAHWLRRPWTYFARPSRLIYVFNTFHPKILSIVTRPRPRPGWPSAEVVFISDFQRRLLNVTGGVVHPSPIDIVRFSPGPRDPSHPITVGRLSRDIRDKYDPRDIPIFRRLADGGVRVRLMGAMTLSDPLLDHPLIERLPEGFEPPDTFLRSLDIFYYRTGAHVETFGRVVLEAMACGLPVVCDRRGGYADHISPGVEGILFDRCEEATAALDRLIEDEEWRHQMGKAARLRVEQLYSPHALAERVQFYCGSVHKAPKVLLRR